MDEEKKIPEGTDQSKDPVNQKPEAKKVKEKRGNFFVKGIRRLGKGVNWCVDKVSRHPKAAIVVISSVGVGAGYLLKTIVGILQDTEGEGSAFDPIETEFADEDSVSEDSAEDNSTEE